MPQMPKMKVADRISFEKCYRKIGFVSSVEDWAKKHNLNVEVAVQEHIEVKNSIISEIKRKKVSSILDIGCGCGFLMSRINEEYPDGNVIGTDISRFELENARFNRVQGSLLMCCAEFMPFKTGAFECVVCSEVIEHVISPKATLLEIERILKTGGCLCISTDNPLSIFRNIIKVASKATRKKTGPKTEYIPLSALRKLIPKTIRVYKILFRCPYSLLPKIGFLGSRILGKVWVLPTAIVEKFPSFKRQLCNKYIIFGLKHAHAKNESKCWSS